MTLDELAEAFERRLDKADMSLGQQLLAFHEVDQSLQGYSNNAFGPSFTDSQLAQLVENPHIDWLKAQVTTEFRGYPISLLTILLGHMPMQDLITRLPAFSEALNARYTPDQQVSILKRSQVMPASVGRSIDGQQFLAGRIAPLIVQDKVHADAWMEGWMSAIKGQEVQGKSLGVSFARTMKPTAAYKNLKPQTDGLQAMPFLMTLAATLDPELFEQAARRFTPANLYQLSNPAFSGSFSNSQRDVYRSNLIFTLHKAPEAQLASLITTEIGQAPISDSNVDVCSAILATSVDWKEPYLPLEELIFNESFGSRDTVDNLLWDYALDWKEDWFAKLAQSPLCRVLKDEVAQYDRFHNWVLRYAQHSQWGSLSSMSTLPQWMSMMKIKDRERSFGLLVKKFEAGITTRTQQFGSGIFYGKLLLSAFPDDPYTHATLNNQVGYLVKRALHDNHGELLTEVIKRGIVDYESVGPRIWDEKEFNCLTQHGWLEKEALLSTANNKTKREVVMSEFCI